MSVVAPITALLAASIPVAIGLLSGERPSSASLAGLVLALIAIGLVTTAPEPGVLPSSGVSRGTRIVGAGLPEALGAGLFFAGFFLLLDRVEDDAGLWPIVGARVAALVVAGPVLLTTGLRVRPAPGTTVAVLVSGLMSNVADYLFLLGTAWSCCRSSRY
jgi:hypothetical protein